MTELEETNVKIHKLPQKKFPQKMKIELEN